MIGHISGPYFTVWLTKSKDLFEVKFPSFTTALKKVISNLPSFLGPYCKFLKPHFSAQIYGLCASPHINLSRKEWVHNLQHGPQTWFK